MLSAGVHLMSLFSVGCELMRDWRDAPGGAAVAQRFYAKWIPSYEGILNSWTATQPPEPETAQKVLDADQEPL